MKSALIYGGSGALGSAICQVFKKNNWCVVSVDFRANSAVDHNISLSFDDSWDQQYQKVKSSLSSYLAGKKLQAIVSVAGGWAGGNLTNDVELIKNVDLMFKQSVHSSVLASLLGQSFLEENGLLFLTGAKAALQGTPGMLAYGMAKASVHQLTKSLATSDSGLPKGVCTVCALPITLDTPANRAGMPNADFTSWTPLETFASKVFEYTSSVDKRPQSGSLIEIVTQKGVTKFNLV